MKIPKYGYICKIDWDYELGEALGGCTIYPSVKDLKANHDFNCGIVKVRIELEEVIEERNLFSKTEE